MKLAWLMAGCFLVVSAVSPARAETYYVATNGIETASGIGDWGNAVVTISNAVAKASDGDAILVSNGTYNTTAELKITNKTLSITGLNGAANTIVKGNNTFSIFHIGKNVALNGLTISSGSGAHGFGPGGGGGGVYMVAGGATVSNCIIRDNSGNWGAGVYANGTAGLDGGGAGVFTVVNCLILGNSGSYGGGILTTTYADSTSIVQNCAIVNNTGVGYGGGLAEYSATHSIIENCIFYGNAGPVDSFDYRNNGGVITYCRSMQTIGGPGNTVGDPGFYNAAAGNYHLLPGSPCLDTGNNEGWMTGASDLDGLPRIINTTSDRGPYEYQLGGLDCGFAATPITGLEPLTVTLTPSAAGTNLIGVGYQWDFENDGTMDGPSAGATNHTYSWGTYSVRLVVTNAMGESNSYTRTGFIVAAPVTIYVKPTGSPSFPYSTWDTAATNIQTAIDSAVGGVTIMVTNGTYFLPSALNFTKAVTLKSVNGWASTTLDGRSADRCVVVSSAAAVIDGFTITHGKKGGFGGAISLYQQGTVKNCVIRGNEATAHYAGAAYLNSGGLLQNCLICCNTGQYAGAIYFNSTGGTIDGCTIVSNTSTQVDFPGAIFFNGGGTVRNSIVYGNKASGGYLNWRNAGSWSYSCTYPTPGGTANTTNNPMFVNFSGGDYRLQKGSDCLNTGTNQTWMNGTFDLLGNSRISGLRVDMGAYERVQPPSGTVMMLR